MVAHYKIIQKHNPNNGDEPKKYYGKLIRMRTLSTPDVVHQIMERSSLKEGDITSVLMNLAKVINYNLMLGDAVKL
ncbi:HU family DNA-binding protein [Lactococcus fujiensis]|uniref:HU domain-containing protein n=1 Tax=Lactococcus fujiensis JCM 16395 TaxID=1291764 RepID=A0A2A5RJX9_9LACT|nr:hypothetical protein [Lactococcus fujiensis]PCR99459.1 hypothetical protein RT41_GL001835 [Lactococcus fujiensis JCM 16395]